MTSTVIALSLLAGSTVEVTRGFATAHLHRDCNVTEEKIAISKISAILFRVSRPDQVPRLPMPGYAGGSAPVRADRDETVSKRLEHRRIETKLNPSATGQFRKQKITIGSHTGKPHACRTAGCTPFVGPLMQRRFE